MVHLFLDRQAAGDLLRTLADGGPFAGSMETMMTTKQKQRQSDPSSTKAMAVKYDAEALANMALKVKAEGFVTAADLKTEFGPEAYTRGIAVLYSDLRMFRRVSRPWKDGAEEVGYEWANRKGFSKSEQKKLPPELGFVMGLTAQMPARYSDFQRVTVRCRYTTPALGGIPVKLGKDEMPTNCFERDAAGRLLILRYNQRAMITPALARIGKEQATGRRIGFTTIRLTPNGNLSVVERPVNDNGQGKGFCRSEKLADGTEFTIIADVPTSVLSVAEFLQALRNAGETIGLSPGRSAGFGDFEVLSAE